MKKKKEKDKRLSLNQAVKIVNGTYDQIEEAAISTIREILENKLGKIDEKEWDLFEEKYKKIYKINGQTVAKEIRDSGQINNLKSNSTMKIPANKVEVLVNEAYDIVERISLMTAPELLEKHIGFTKEEWDVIQEDYIESFSLRSVDIALKMKEEIQKRRGIF